MPQIIVTGQRATGRSGRSKRWSVRETATNAGGSNTKTRSNYVGVGGPDGSPRIRLLGVRASAAAAGRAGIPGKVTRVAGVRAQATAAGRAGTAQVTFGSRAVTGARAQARSSSSAASWGRTWGTDWGGGNAGTVIVTAGNAVIVTGDQAIAQAASDVGGEGQAGSPIVRVTGTRAQATSSARSGAHAWAVRLTATNTGGSDTKTRVGYVTVSGAVGSPKVSLTGPRAQATAAGRPGGINVAFGVRATATATARPSSPTVRVGNLRATATAAGRAGTVVIANGSNITLGGSRATATASGTAGADLIKTSAAAAAVAAGRAGNVHSTYTGARAAGTGTGRAGSPHVTVTGDRATAFASDDSIVQLIIGRRATAVAAGRAGVVPATIKLTGARAFATATGRAGTLQTLQPATTPMTKRTETMTGQRRTLVRVRSGRTRTIRTY